MKKALITVSLFVLVSSFLISSCKKKTTDTTPTPTPTPAPAANVLCNGNGSSSYFPLALNDSWIYVYYIAGISQSVSPDLVVTGTATYNSINYFQITDQTSAMYSGVIEFREDAATHNIYYYSSNSEFLYVPATPTLNQSWAYAYGDTRKVTNVSASVTTNSCSYTGLLEISEFNSSSVLQKIEYFKKGIGMVYRKDPDSFFGGFSTYKLSDVTLH